MTADNDGDSAHVFTVGELAERLGVSVRTLHYWEERGVLCPSTRTWAGHRVYSTADMKRAQLVLVYRSTGMPLRQVKEILGEGPAAHDDDVSEGLKETSPKTSPSVEAQQDMDARQISVLVRNLEQQRRALVKDRDDVARKLELVDRLLEQCRPRGPVSLDEIATIVGEPKYRVYAEEAEATWGDTEDWAQSIANQKYMGRAEWRSFASEMQELEQACAYAMRSGVIPGCPEANSLAERHRKLLSRHFPVTPSKHVLIARFYTDDPRFAAHFDRYGDGLSVWMRKIIDANSACYGVNADSAQWE
ncbi:MerR family transcriptional regulator [Corynebacterium parakroppenstedtii]|uniref:MerR family transcriptional regulator n=1 Tax=Corynebacterium parakroppenstedtii TaxID=2828363 RepID=UPI001C8DAC77|nr:MerR family transcriptional regulator [Corynebacterium parakroppenstedtii]MBY0788628.1 MerR family transcriptional regulator [Corynebacterium parakroppenstedtii]MBY0796791.1 MerR family transcriptional regulator [Corynebacterium parakroppenstedtii]